ncbi:unnamed protein product [Vitrella brassicaformis CCMP3155]|uniref:non-specific serine/threonine protein kinase n=2 Tax=Vitrella brassicaformis TaxID=1169539 RepID=A0A0G4GLN8_VITBC|nr:unnamed protein product [Vitrella brassicaformis CCMP3155]|mmetsp:Transcript_18254/g.43918  ORF Transcript_18254/g.43918 Transcript_18254/m.43918 type:complete len:698 (+) Transcript_18254:180-2273(+)|eukprot:CEM31033.1 unnamed protein product [Vitrella brassicaformis CCMP3155]
MGAHCSKKDGNEELVHHRACIEYSRVHHRPIQDDYAFCDKVLGTGFSGPVRLAVNRTTNKRYAVKPFNKKAANKERIDLLKNEAEIYLHLDHPNIARLIDIYEDSKNVWMVMEYCSGKELYQRLNEKHVYKEQDAAEVTFQMLEAVHYLHAHNVVHRDLKLENWLYEDPSEHARLKLIDFGFSKIWNPRNSKKMHATCGSLAYVSPDTLSGSYTNACDMWSLGVIVYMLLVGYPPFYGTEAQILDRIAKAQYSMSGSRWERVSPQAKNFVSRLLQRNPQKRMSAKEALEHPWITHRVRLPEVHMDRNVLKSMKSFAVATHLKRAALTMMAYCLTSAEIHELTDMFLQFDKSQAGSITLRDFMDVMTSNFDLSSEEIEKLFHSLETQHDKVNDGDAEHPHEVCYSDFIAAMLQQRVKLHEDLIREAFHRFDTDQSGYITSDNLREVLGLSYEGEEIEAIIRVADKDGDGQIDYEEFLAAVVHEPDLFSEAGDESPAKSLRGSVDDAKKLKTLVNLVDVQVAQVPGDTRLQNLAAMLRNSTRSSPEILKRPLNRRTSYSARELPFPLAIMANRSRNALNSVRSPSTTASSKDNKAAEKDTTPLTKAARTPLTSTLAPFPEHPPVGPSRGTSQTTDRTHHVGGSNGSASGSEKSFECSASASATAAANGGGCGSGAKERCYDDMVHSYVEKYEEQQRLKS